MKRNNPPVIGLTGGVGAGKSRILRILEEEYGAAAILADQVAAELEEPGQEGLRLLAEHFGMDILDGDGRLDRNAFARRIFTDPDALAAVNAIIHPMTWQEICRRIQMLKKGAGDKEAQATGQFTRQNVGVQAAEQDGETQVTPPLIVVEAALFDEKSRSICDQLWYVDVTEENRIRRLMENRGYTREKCLDIMANQPDRQRFLALADEVIDNNGPLEEVEAQLEKLLAGLGISKRQAGNF